MKHVFCSLALGTLLCLGLVSAALAAQEVPAPSATNLYHGKIGNLDVWIMAVTQRDQPAEVLLPRTEAHKQAIAKAYPDGKMRNAMSVMLVRGKDYLALVDTGLPSTTSGLMAGLQAAGVRPDEVTHVVITHAHGDHVGGLTTEGKALFPKAKVLFSEKEHDFWLNPDTQAANRATAPERARGMFDQLPQLLAPYAGRVETVPVDKEFLSGLTLLPAYGHTPGHVAVLVRSNGEGQKQGQGASHAETAPEKPLLFWADLMHGALVQMDYPEVGTAYDFDLERSIAARKALMQRASSEGWQVSGVHLPGVVPVELK